MADQVPLPRFLMYAAVGAVGTGAHYTVLLAAVSLGLLAPVGATACGAVVGATVNFLLNARVTFRARASWDSAVRFVITAALAAAANALAIWVLVDWWRLPWLPAQLMVTAGLLLLTFFVNSLWTFRSGRTG
jgi:putative flippase GtrA